MKLIQINIQGGYVTPNINLIIVPILYPKLLQSAPGIVAARMVMVLILLLKLALTVGYWVTSANIVTIVLGMDIITVSSNTLSKWMKKS